MEQQSMNQQNMNQGQNLGNLHSSNQVGFQQNHGGHEIFDAHEVLSCLVGTLDQYMLFRQYVKDPELTDILNRQYTFMTDQYNRLVETLSTGQKPSKQATTYMMKQNHDVIYGLKQAQPKKPIQSASEINDAWVSGQMMAAVKAICSGVTMAALESTNPVLRRVLSDSLPNYIELGYELFLYQNKHQYYQVPQLSMEDTNYMIHAYAPSTNQNMMQ
ncbi:spore coat protein CotF [Bacillus oleivorans]|uniref:Spore coat protein CotF n=1 Tax=Bacillus oleivorans TaxID=1448271 RepID=A0A285CSE6_9BACI|nr:spore coat protein [Bacillus oleivorans]SNX69873.1 spore coat protein CotF [Bacillus oleivorans]